MKRQHYVATGVMPARLQEYVVWGAELGWEVAGVVPDLSTGTLLQVVWKECGVTTGTATGLPTWRAFVSR